MAGEFVKALRAGVVTSRYPGERAEPPLAFRGAPELRAGTPFVSLPSPAVCPTGAIEVGGGRASVDLGRCVFCGRCRDAGAVALGHDFELAARRRQDLVFEVRSDAGGTVAPAPASDELPARVSDAIRRTLGRSLHLRHLDAGSCNGCDWELTALLSPHYDVRRLGIDFVASPRHADGVIVTGPVTRNLEAAVRRTYAAVPDPRVVIAVGACGCSGGIAGTSYASAGGVAAVLPVDAFVPGCPPRPEAILFGILVAVGRLEPRLRRR